MAKIKLEKDTKDVLDKQKVLHDWVASEGYQSFKRFVMRRGGELYLFAPAFNLLQMQRTKR